MRFLILMFCLGFAGCSSMREAVYGTAAAPPTLAVEELLLTTEVEGSSFEPSGTPQTSFSAEVHEIFACFRITSPNRRERVTVGWYRQGEGAAFQSAPITARVGRWSADLLEVLGRLEPGNYVVRVSSDGNTLAEAPFTVIPGSGSPSPAEPSAPSDGIPYVSNLTILRELDASGRPRPGAPSLTIVPNGTTELYCAFTITGAQPTSRVSARWLRGSESFHSTDLGSPRNGEVMVASVRSDDGFRAGLYRVEITLDDRVVRSGTFVVQESSSAELVGARVTSAVLTTAVEDRTGLPAAPALSEIGHDVSELYLSITFSSAPAGGVIEVHWFRDGQPEPIALERFSASGRGSLAAVLSLEGGLEAGPYHVNVVLGTRTLATVRFQVTPDPEAPAAAEEPSN